MTNTQQEPSLIGMTEPVTAHNNADLRAEQVQALDEILDNVGNNVLDNVKSAIDEEGFGVPKAVAFPLIALAKLWHKGKRQEDWNAYFWAYELVVEKYGSTWTALAVEKYCKDLT